MHTCTYAHESAADCELRLGGRAPARAFERVQRQGPGQGTLMSLQPTASSGLEAGPQPGHSSGFERTLPGGRRVLLPAKSDASVATTELDSITFEVDLVADLPEVAQEAPAQRQDHHPSQVDDNALSRLDISALSSSRGVAELPEMVVEGLPCIEESQPGDSTGLQQVSELQGGDSLVPLDEFGRMNGPYPHVSEPPPTPKPAPPLSRPRARSRSRGVGESPPRPQTGHRCICVVSSAFGRGVVVADISDSQAGYNHAVDGIQRVAASGATFYIGITENLARRWQEHSAAWDYLQ